MTEQQDPQLLDHEADGIQELDNLLPRWWLWLFYITIIFSVIYVGYFHVLDIGKSSATKYENERAAAQAHLATDDTEDAGPFVTEPSSEAAVLAAGKTVYTTHCVACHGMNGEGLVGPNFCDDYFMHGPTFTDSVTVIVEGVPAKGMISWKPLLKSKDIHAVASYIWQFRGTTPPNPKPPEGEKHEG